MYIDPRKSKSTKLCPLVGSGTLYFMPKTILCFVLDSQENILLNICVSSLQPSETPSLLHVRCLVHVYHVLLL